VTDSPSLEERVSRYLQSNPETGLPAIAGALGEDPATIADVLGETVETQSGADESDETPTPEPAEAGPQDPETWANAGFSSPESDIWPPAHTEHDSWMLRKDGKSPWAPWTDPDAPVACTRPEHETETTAAECDHSARFKWGSDGSEEFVHADVDTALDWREKHPEASEDLVFIQSDADPFGFVDGDDVRCPETGNVHPAFVQILETLGLTYADVSTSGSGVHAMYKGELPGDQGQAVFEIDDEPWGENDDAPTVEIYANKHVCIATGEHIPGTPVDVRQWDEDGVQDVLEEYDARKEPTDIAHDTDDERDDLGDYDPDATGSDETTTEIRDVLKAVDELEPADIRLRTSQVGSDATGWEQWDPSSYRTSSGNDSLHRPPQEPVFHDHKHGEAFGVLSLLAAEENIITNPWDRLSGRDWWEAVETARDKGASIPEYVGSKDAESEDMAVLPPAVRDLSTATSGWDWRHAGRDDDTLSIEDARERTVDTIANAYKHGDYALVEALPTMGKSYGSVKAAAETGEQITIVTGRGRKEQYDQFRDWCDEHGLSYYTLPSFTRDCDTANGEHGQEWAEKVRDWYNRGATPKEIHKSAEYHLGRPLPCQEHEGQNCPYASKWDFDPDEFDVLIGHYSHAHKSKVTSGRTVVFDEFPDAYETKLGIGLQGAVSYWLQTTDGVPFEDYTDLLENRDDQERRGRALLWFEDNGVEPDESVVFDDGAAHASAPLAVFTILAADDLGNGFEQASVPDVGTGVRNRHTDEVTILRPPEMDYASGVVALDGTPTKRLWELSLGRRMNHRPVLQDDERTEYVRDALNLNIVRTSEYVKPYNSADHVNTQQDAALLEQIRENHGEAPSLITTTTAEDEYDAAGVLETVDETKHYGNVLGSNEFKEKRVGAVIGSNHFSDDYIKKWGAYDGRTVDRNDGKGSELSYGAFGDKVLTHMREHETIQATMRFGRDGNGAVVYVHTDTLPEWVPVAGEGRVVTTWSDGMQQVCRALEDLESATTADIVTHDAVDIGRRQVFDHLESLRERDVLERTQDETDGRSVRWTDDGVCRVNEHGDVELEPVELDDLDENEVAELSRSSIYTWEFRNSPGDSSEPAPETDQTDDEPSGLVTDGGRTPPDGG
jgi:hypothetical protein